MNRQVKIYLCKNDRAFTRIRTYAHRTNKKHTIKKKNVIVDVKDDFISKLQKLDGIEIKNAIECHDIIGEVFYKTVIE